MGIAHFIREIGRGKQGAKDLSREQACALMTEVLGGSVNPVALGAFCVAMRIKGETADEMMGFLDAIQKHLQMFSNPHEQPIVVLPSYNGARRLPLLTPLLAMLLARQGHAVLVHGCKSEDSRLATEDVFSALGLESATQAGAIAKGELVYAPTQLLSPAVYALLQVRRQTGLRNSAHSLVKLMNPVNGTSLQIASYTHPEYAASMQQTLERLQAHALLLRGTEGEPVADPRKIPVMSCFVHGHAAPHLEIQAESSHLTTDMPIAMNAKQTADFITHILAGHIPVPHSIQAQTDVISRLSLACVENSLPGKPL
jgi:anthranilate phosphoribosyltransferase